MENNTTDSGIRVTRSLRKRLTSVDSDNSSRPGTPITTKLTSISETSTSPSRSTRMTRRNSVCDSATPVKTPAKRGVGTAVILENLEKITPSKRSTRRRSISEYENEGNSQTSSKIPTFAPLDEGIRQTSQKTNRVTRSQSKSPQDIKMLKTSPSPKKSKDPNTSENKGLKVQNIKADIPKKRKAGPKSKTLENEEYLSEVEVTVLRIDIEDIKKKSSNISTIVLDDITEVTSKCIEGNQNQIDNEKSSKTETDFKFSHAISHDEKDTLIKHDMQQFKENINENPSLTCTEQKDTSTNHTISNIEVSKEAIDEKSHQKKCEDSTKSCQSNEIDNVGKQNLNISIDNKQEITNVQDLSDIENELNCDELTMTDNKINLSFNENVEFNIDSNNAHPINVKEVKEKPILSDKIEIESISNLTPYRGDGVNDYTTPEAKGKPILSDKVEILSVNNLTPYSGDGGEPNINVCEASLKKVKFVSSPNYMSIKNVYPKTPASMKTLKNSKEISSSRDDDSFQIKDNSLEINLDNHQNATSISEDSKIEITKEAATNMTPIHGIKCPQTLEIVQSESLINMEVAKIGDALPVAEKNAAENEKLNVKTSLSELEKSPGAIVSETDITRSSANKILDSNEDYSPNLDKTELKWINPSVRVTSANGSKLDVVVTQNNANTSVCCDNTNYVGKQTEKSKKSIIFSSEDEEHESSEDERKHDILDDEAMEVDDYESGDSMSTEERKEIEENEIPIYDESIGSHTTEGDLDECVEEEDSDNADSFIVSDNEEPARSEIDIEEVKIDEDMIEHNCKKNKKTYKRLLRPEESLSSSSDEELEVDQDLNDHQSIGNDENTHEKREYCNKSVISQPAINEIGDENVTETKQLNIKAESNSYACISDANNLLSKSSENIILDSSKLSDSALRLHCSAESESEEEEINTSRKAILRNLNQTDRFNKSVRDLNPEIDASSTENIDEQCIAKRNPESVEKSNNEMFSDEGHTTLSSPEESANKTRNSNKMQSGGDLEKVSATSESEADKENECKSVFISQHQNTDIELGGSFSNCKQPKERQEWRRSFTIDVSVKGEKMETAVSDIKLRKAESAFTSLNDDQENEKLKSEDVNYIKNIRHMPLPLGNPLIRTRRQSLALPTNPDRDICSSHMSGADKRANRKSLGVVSSMDFNPSQSFIDSIELKKSENKHLISKRKRLSKSFCGASESHDISVVDIDVDHLHKRSKLMSESSIAESCQDSIENISKLFTKISSTPHEKINKGGSYNNQHILKRCDEILEAANLAKLKDKIRNKKNKVKTSKKRSKKKTILTSSDETNPDNMLRGISKEINRKDKTKTALSHALKAADVIISRAQKRKIHPNMKEETKLQAKQLAPDVPEVLGESIAMQKTSKKENIHNQEQMRNIHTSSTSAGNIKEFPQSPEKRRKTPTYIQLPTGKMSVEPVSPQKRIVKALNGMQFMESPITPSAIGFKVRQISPPGNNITSASILRKRKRCHNESFKDCTSTKSQWTKSGVFLEENIAKNRQIPHSESPQLWDRSQKTKKRLMEREEHNANRNFKETAMMRPDIRRSSKREILLLKERRQLRGHY